MEEVGLGTCRSGHPGHHPLGKGVMTTTYALHYLLDRSALAICNPACPFTRFCCAAWRCRPLGLPAPFHLHNSVASPALCRRGADKICTRADPVVLGKPIDLVGHTAIRSAVAHTLRQLSGSGKVIDRSHVAAEVRGNCNSRLPTPALHPTEYSSFTPYRVQYSSTQAVRVLTCFPTSNFHLSNAIFSPRIHSPPQPPAVIVLLSSRLRLVHFLPPPAARRPPPRRRGRADCADDDLVLGKADTAKARVQALRVRYA